MSLDTLKQWVGEGRVHRQTKLTSASDDSQVAAGDIPDLFAEPVQTEPPAAKAPPPQAPPLGSEPSGERLRAKQGWPAWAIVLTVLAGLGVLVLVLLAAMLFPVFTSAKAAATKAVATAKKQDDRKLRDQGLRNMKDLGLATVMYTVDFDDRYPPVMESAVAAKPYIAPYAKSQAIFNSSNPSGGEISGNRAVGGMSEAKIPDPSDTVLFFDSKPWESETGPEGLACYGDGHAGLKPFQTVQDLLARDPTSPAPTNGLDPSAN